MRAALLLLPFLPVAAAATQTDGSAEYAVRWETGGPQDAQEVLRALGWTGKVDTSSYTVRYFASMRRRPGCSRATPRSAGCACATTGRRN